MVDMMKRHPLPDTPLKTVFAGTPDFAAQHLNSLLNSNLYTVEAVFTQPDRPKGRGKKLISSTVKQLAEKNNIPVYQPERFLETDPFTCVLQTIKPDIMIVVAYGILLPKFVLNIPKHGCINVHASILPQWRGASPIQYAIMGGCSTTGITVMQMDAGMDSGDILYQVMLPIMETDNTLTLTNRLAEKGQEALAITLHQLVQGTLNPVPQNHDAATYARKITKQTSKIDWNQSSEYITRSIRALYPQPIAWAMLHDTTIRFWEAQANKEPVAQIPGTIISAQKEGLLVACGQGSILMKTIQLPGKKALSFQEIINGNKTLFTPGTVLQ